MHFTTEHQSLRETVLRFVAAEINPHVEAWEREGLFPAHELFGRLGALGLLGVTKPTAYGGMGLDYSYGAMVNEALGHINCGGVPMAIGVQTDMATPALARHGSDALRTEFLAPSIAGERVACIGVTEPGAGSDVAAIATRAEKHGGDYVITGSKMFITNGVQADWMCMLVNTGGDHAHRNKSLICVPLKNEDGSRPEGLVIEKKLDKLGMRSSDTALMAFDGVRVPQRYLIGAEGMGFSYQMQQFQEERLYSALCLLGPLQMSIDETIEYTGQRQAFSQPVLDNQIVHYRLAELQTEIEALRALIWQAIETHVSGENCTMQASMAKVKACRLVREVTDTCLQYWGGMGYMSETPISRRYRDTRMWSIGGGADEVMLHIICKHMGTLPQQERR